MPSNEFYISQDYHEDMVDKYVDDISLTDEKVKDIEYFTRGQQSCKSWLQSCNLVILSIENKLQTLSDF